MKIKIFNRGICACALLGSNSLRRRRQRRNGENMTDTQLILSELAALRQDMKEMEEQLRQDMKEMEGQLRQDIKLLENRVNGMDEKLDTIQEDVSINREVLNNILEWTDQVAESNRAIPRVGIQG